MVKLVVVRPDGFSFNLVDGVLRAKFREGFETPKMIEPGAVLPYDIDLWATSYEIQEGERLRIDVTSSNFPRFDRNPNTGAPFAETDVVASATQMLYLDADYPSHVTLPFIPSP